MKQWQEACKNHAHSSIRKFLIVISIFFFDNSTALGELINKKGGRGEKNIKEMEKKSFWQERGEERGKRNITITTYSNLNMGGEVVERLG